MAKKPGIKLLITTLICTSFCFVGYKVFFKSSDELIFNGNVEVQDVNVSFRVSGRISKIMFDEGQNVKNGEIIATLDKDILESQLKLATAKMKEAEFNFKNCKKDFIRNKELYKKKSISEKVYDDVTMKYHVSEAQRDAATSNFELAKISLNDAVLKSPVDGIILTRNIEVGEMINSGTAAFAIMPNRKTRIKTFANEASLSKIKYNDKVYVNIETMPNKKFVGHIGFISSEAEFTPKNIETKELRTSLMYRVRVIIDEAAPELKEGMPVTVRYADK